LEDYPNQEIKLVGFAGVAKTTLATAQTDEKGTFTLSHQSNTGVGHVLIPEKNQGVLVFLTDADIVFELKKGQEFSGIHFSKGSETSV
jgi:hypothetical protein